MLSSMITDDGWHAGLLILDVPADPLVHAIKPNHVLRAPVISVDEVGVGYQSNREFGEFPSFLGKTGSRQGQRPGGR